MKRFSVLVPVLTLVGCAIGWSVQRWMPRTLAPIHVRAQPSASLGALVRPPHAGSIDARIFAADGAPVPDALVWLRAGSEPHWTYSGEDGSFHFDSLEDGPWPTTIVARGFQPFRAELSAGEGTQRIDLGVRAAPTPRFEAAPRRELHGRIVAGVARELAGFEVVLVPAPELAERSGAVPRRTFADETGAFTIDDLDVGPYQVRVRPAWARSGTWPDLLTALGEPRPRTIVHDPDAAPIELALVSSEVRGVLTSREGTPLEGALVLVTPALDASRVWPPISSDSEGRFVARDLPAGAYRVAVRAGAASAEALVELGPSESREVTFAPLDVR